MQTFVPTDNINTCAFLLDRQRLGKQRVECLQLLRGHFPNHPCHDMWRGYRQALALYGLIICKEWVKRGYNDTCAEKIDAEVGGIFKIQYLQAATDDDFFDTPRAYSNVLYYDKEVADNTPMPPWWGDDRVHRSHRSNLIRKDDFHYRRYFALMNLEIPPNHLEYVWPKCG